LTPSKLRWRLAPWLAGAAFFAAGCADDAVGPDAASAPEAPVLSATAEVAWTELEPLPGENNASAVAVNRWGQVVGSSGDLPVLWENGQPQELDMPEDATLGRPHAINDAGQTTGHVTGEHPPRVVVWDRGTIIEVGTLPEHDRSLARDISNAGHVVGTSTSGSILEGIGFIWLDGGMDALPPLSDDSSSDALFVNSSGVAVGVSRDDYTDRKRFVLWEDGEVTEIAPTLPHESYDLVGMTDEGEVVFSAEDGEDVFIWHEGDLRLVRNPDEDATWYAALAASPGGLILGLMAFPSGPFNVEHGIWVDDDDFIRLEPSPPVGTCVGVGDGGWVTCRGDGRSVLGSVPLDPSPEGVGEILAFFDDAVESGRLRGVGPGLSGSERLRVLRNMLETAKGVFEQQPPAACGPLMRVLRRTEGFPGPPAFVEGPAAPELAEHIRALMARLGC